MLKQTLILTASIILSVSNSLLASGNNPDTLKVKDTLMIAPDDPVLLALDHMARSPFIDLTRLDTDSVCLNIYGFEGDTIPQYPNEYYREKLAELDKLTPFNLVYNDRVLAFIKLYTEKRRSQTEKLLGLQQYYFPMFEEMLDKYDMPFELKYLAVIESALNPRARSRAGAVGLWQFMYSTGKLYGLHQNSYMDERMDPIKSTDAALRYLQYLYDIYGKWDLALAAYNCGPGNVNRAMRRSGSKDGNYWDLYPYLPRETRGYVPAFIAVNYVMNNAEAHNLYPKKPRENFFELDTVHIRQPVSFDVLAKALNMSVEEIALHNPTYRRNYIPAYSNKTSILYLPYDKLGVFVSNEKTIYAMDKPKTQNTGEQVKKFQEDRIIYRVRPGDYLGKIANRYHVRVRDLKAWNGLRSNTLRIGQRLVIYPKGYVASAPKTAQKKSTAEQAGQTNASSSQKEGDYIYYKIRSGDTLWDIAKAKGVSVNQLKSWNKTLNYRNLKPGTKIIVGVSG